MQSTPFDTPEQRRSNGNRERLGDWETDTIVGFNHKSGVLTLVDRRSRFLIAVKLTRLGSKEVKAALGVDFYFPPPHHPWERGTNENTNSLLREYFKKGYDFNNLTDEELQAVDTFLLHLV